MTLMLQASHVLSISHFLVYFTNLGRNHDFHFIDLVWGYTILSLENHFTFIAARYHTNSRDVQRETTVVPGSAAGSRTVSLTELCARVPTGHALSLASPCLLLFLFLLSMPNCGIQDPTHPTTH